MRQTDNSNPNGAGTCDARTHCRCDKRFLPHLNRKRLTVGSQRSSSSSEAPIRRIPHICPPCEDEKHTRKRLVELELPHFHSKSFRMVVKLMVLVVWHPPWG
jgi:hypothetical protein